MALLSSLQPKPLGAQFNKYSLKTTKKKLLGQIIATVAILLIYPKTSSFYNNDDDNISQDAAVVVPDQPAVAMTSMITCDYTKGVGSCIDPTGVEGEWVYVGPERSLAAPVCCEWLRAKFKENEEQCGTEQLQLHKGEPHPR